MFFISAGRRREQRKYKELIGRMARRKFVERLLRQFRKMNIKAEVIVSPDDSDIATVLPYNFSHHEIYRINLMIDRIYGKVWQEYRRNWSYAVLHGAKANRCFEE